MIINEKTVIYGEKTVLVPYEECHVVKYHGWMQSDELLSATASERLNLQEEYEMQKSWRRDDDKLTFIVLDKKKLDEGEVAAMIGDSNLFMASDDTAEVMIMIAEPEYRRLGYGREVTSLILRYGIDALKLKKYLAKITADNTGSIALFKKLGFEVVSSSDVFNEVTMEKVVTDYWKKELAALSPYGVVERV